MNHRQPARRRSEQRGCEVTSLPRSHRIISQRATFALLLTAALVCAVPRASLAQSDAETEVETGNIRTRTYDFRGAGEEDGAAKRMDYALYVPTGYDKSKPTPLIVALHGLYSNPRQIVGYPGFVKHAEGQGYIIAAPMGYNSRGWYGSRGAGGRGKDPKNLGELSERDVMNVLNIVREEFNIDPQRIFLLGHSMGGGGTLHLAMKHPDIWAALAPIAPAVPRNIDDLEKAKHIPAIVIQGDRDGLVHGTRRWVEKMKELEMKHEYIEVKGGGHVFVAFQHFPEIFDFFAAHPKPAASAAEEVNE